MKHIIGFSGGIDSQAAAAVILDRFGPDDVILTNSDAGGNEDPITVEFIDWYDANVHPVVRCNAIVADMWETPGFAETKGYDGNARLTFDLMAKIKGRWPSRTRQFCTEKLKIVPQRRWLKQAFGTGGEYEGESYARYTGIRRDESDPRKNTPDCQWDDFFDCELYAPIADWTKKQCFDFVLRRGERINPLYSMGFNRVGCAPCINSGKKDILNWWLRRPAMIDKLRNWEHSTGRTYFAPCLPGMRTNNIDQVLEWAKTSRGGRQQMFPIMHERAACESKYGLCE